MKELGFMDLLMCGLWIGGFWTSGLGWACGYGVFGFGTCFFLVLDEECLNAACLTNLGGRVLGGMRRAVHGEPAG